KKSGKKGLFVATIASHGFMGDDLDALVAEDSVYNHMKSTGPRLSTLLGTIRDASRTAAKRQLVLVDACRNQVVKARGGGDAAPMANAFAEAIEQARGQVVLAATVPGGFAYDDHDRQNGVFTAAMLDGLRGAAPSNEEGLVTVEALAHFVNEQVVAWVELHKPQDVDASRGIHYKLEDVAAAGLPLAFDAEFFERAEQWTLRRTAALKRLRGEIDDDVIDGALYGRVADLLRSGTEAQLAAWAERIELLDGSVTARESFAFFAQRHLDATVEKIAVKPQVPAVRTGRRTEPQVGDVWTDPVLGMRFRYIPPGSFLMGSPEDELGRQDKESQLPVALPDGFWIAETVVTQGQWRALIGNNPSAFAESDEHPVEMVNWFEAITYANALSRKADLETCYVFSGSNGIEIGAGFEAEGVKFDATRNGFRLPTEEQWEYAARSGTETPFWTGDNISTNQANFDGNHPYSDHPKGEWRKATVPVRSFEPNPWGLYEVHGNVNEWCWNRQEVYLAARLLAGWGVLEKADRVTRGGAWNDHACDVRAACRDWYLPSARNAYLGFRLSRGPVQAEPSNRRPAPGPEASACGGAAADHRGAVDGRPADDETGRISTLSADDTAASVPLYYWDRRHPAGTEAGLGVAVGRTARRHEGSGSRSLYSYEPGPYEPSSRPSNRSTGRIVGAASAGRMPAVPVTLLERLASGGREGP
ncbi:MAG: SUMF1/EgtB/PvdO family nonheme iron enzyme, partial [Acidobacteriota bacterium]